MTYPTFVVSNASTTSTNWTIPFAQPLPLERKPMFTTGTVVLPEGHIGVVYTHINSVKVAIARTKAVHDTGKVNAAGQLVAAVQADEKARKLALKLARKAGRS